MRMGRTTLDGIISKCAKLARIRKRVACHLQEILGHRSLATTERYLRVTITELKGAHRKYHPREKLARQP